MQIIADVHIHSKYSRAVSPQMNLEGLARWSDIKGIGLIGTGDFTHPLWFKELSTKLTETQPGIYQLKGSSHHSRFILTTELSSIYSQGGKVRRVHNVIMAPSLNTVNKINKELLRRGVNLLSDGRPILGISSKDLLNMMLSIDDNILFIPAHIWTPWFSVFGSKSGFDSLVECFGDDAKYIYGIETGLSSDPIMNWQIDELNTRSILSSSDAHSGPKLGREATVFVPINPQNNTLTLNDLSFIDYADAIKQRSGGRLKIGYTIEFFPEEGKYHYTGHRSCNIRYSAIETKSKGTICPVCQKPLTVGVENRVLDLSSISLTANDLLMMKNKVGLTFVSDNKKLHRPFVSIIPLLEVLMEINNGSPTKANLEYNRLIENLGTEFEILLKKDYQQIEQIGGLKLKQAIEIIRNRQAYIDPGYDGVFGKVKVFNNNEKEKTETVTQSTMF